MGGGQAEYLRRRNIRIARASRLWFLASQGLDAWRRRHLEILSLPRKTWKGRIVLGITCDSCGKVRWVGEYLFWQIISLRRFLCEWCLVRG